MPAGVVHADDRPVACHGLRDARVADTLEHRYGIPPIWQTTLPGPRLPADQSEHVGTGDDVSVPLAVASAIAMGIESHSNAHPACAASYSFSSTPAPPQARPHPRAPATTCAAKSRAGRAGISGNSLRSSASVQASLAPAEPVVCLDHGSAVRRHDCCRAAVPEREEGIAS